MSIQTEGLSLCYGDGDQITYAVRDVTTSFPERGFFGIMGPSGSGKSSLLYLLSGLKLPSKGNVRFRGELLASMSDSERGRLRRTTFGFVFQQPFLLQYLTAFENVMVAAANKSAASQRKVHDLLEELNIGHLSKRYPAHLSGGERQRLVVARAMVNEPSVIFADEPTAALDHANGHTVIELLKRYRDRGAVLVVTHDPEMLKNADFVYHMADGALKSVSDLQSPVSL